MQRLGLLLVVVFFLLLPGRAQAGDAQQPHPHRGVLARYAEPPPLVLSDDEQRRLKAGEHLVRPVSIADPRPGIVFRVHASPVVVWSVIQNLRGLPRAIEEVRSVETLKRDGEHVISKMTLSSTGLTFEEFVDHHFRQQRRFCTWTLDYSKQSDLDDSVGFWRVDAADVPDESIVEYSAEVRASSWSPAFLQSMINDKSLRATPAWVRKSSEAAVAAASPKTVQPTATQPTAALPR